MRYVNYPLAAALDACEANPSERTCSVPHRILCAYDESAAADRAFELALKLTRYFAGELNVLSVLQPPDDATGVRPDVLRKSAESAFAPAFARLRAKAEAAECQLTCVAAIGFPWQQILSHAEQVRADHIVMGHRGRNGFQHGTVGSVSQKIVAKAAVPVTIVP